MSILEVIWRWATLFLAEILNVSAGAAETILRSQTRWVAHLRLMANNLSAAASASEGEDVGKVEAETVEGTPPFNTAAMRQVMDSYAVLNRALRNLKGRGLALDDGLLERMKQEWSQDSVIAYLRSCDSQLKGTVEEALGEAADALGPGVPNPAEIALGAPASAGKPVGAKPVGAKPVKSKPATRRTRELTN